MEDNYPVLRAPSIPKLNKTNISSPLKGEGISSAAQLKRSRFSFLKKPSLNPEGLKKEVEEKKESTSSIKVVADSLIETNRILVEIQNQLAIDFATRITEDKKQVSKIRSAKSKKRFAEKEAAIETAMGIARSVGNQVNKILSPAKSIFDKIKEFFATIFTGLLANAALDWLSDENNRKKFLGVLKFLLDHWKWIVGALVVGKFLGFLLKVVSVAKRLKQFIDFFRKKPPGSGPCGCDDKPKPRGPAGGPSDPCAPILNCIKDRPPELEAFAEKLSKTSKFKPIFDLLPFLITLRPKPIQTPKPQLNAKERYLQSLPPGVREDALKGGKTASPLGDAAIMAAVAALISPLLGLGGSSGAAATGTGAAEASSALNNIIKFQRSLKSSPTLLPRSKGGIIPNIGILGFSQGGNVGGRGSGKVDSVPAMLAPGEFVIKEAAARLFKPLLSDINESAGRLWGEFKQAVIKLMSLTSAQNDNAKKFSKTLDDLNKYFKDKKQKQTIKDMPAMGGGEVIGTVGSSPEIKTPKISPSKISDTSISNTESPKSMASMIKMPELNLNPKNTFQKTEQIFPVQPVIFDGNQSTNFNDNVSKQQNLSFNFNIKNIIKQNDLTPKKRSSSSPNIIPINMPTVRGKMPQIQMPQVPQTEVPAISSVNMANPYMQLTPSLYGIFV